MLLLPTGVMTLDLGVLWLATPALAADLGPSNTQVLWINDSYGLAIASTLVLMGNLGDRVGHRRLLVVGAVVFSVASVLAAFAWSPGALIAARAILGIAGAAIIPSTLALVRELYSDPAAQERAVAAWVTTLSAGVAIGPVVGGIVVAHWWWGASFLVGIPVMLPLLLLAPAVLPLGRSPGTRRLDLWSVPLLVATTVPMVLAVKSVGEYGIASGRTLVPLAIATLTGWVFVRRQRTLDQPLLDLSLLSVPRLRLAVGLLVVGLMAMNGVEYLTPQLLQLVHEVRPVQAGLLMVVPALGLAVGSQLTPRLAARLGQVPAVGVGAAVATGALVALSLPAVAGSPPVLVTVTAVMMTGLAPIAVVGTSIVVSSAPPDKAGQAAGIGQTAYELGLALGIAVIGTAATGLYSARLSASAPVGADGETLERLRGGFTAVGGDDGSHEALFALAREAFVDGFRLAALLGAAACALIVVAVGYLTRRDRVAKVGVPLPCDAGPDASGV